MATSIEIQHNHTEQTAFPLIFTDAAACKVQALIDEEENPHLSLRVYITGGGCSGFQYGFSFDETIQPDDWVLKRSIMDNNHNEQIVKLLIDPLSSQYLQGAEIDYRENLQGAQFVIRNPNAKTTCGCGSSFAIEETK